MRIALRGIGTRELFADPDRAGLTALVDWRAFPGMLVAILLATSLVQAPPIASALSDGLQLVYESNGVAQAPWVYDSVRIIERAGFDRCAVVTRRSQAPHESCVRGDTLFQRNARGVHVPARPIGPDMRVEVRTATGNILLYETGGMATRRVAGGLEVTYLPTSIVTRDAAGAVTRRLREQYAPALLTALWGVFEEPDASGGWRSVREFSLREVCRTERPPMPPRGCHVIPPLREPRSP